jgi:Cdc6-like AAA superfamily ATPase
MISKHIYQETVLDKIFDSLTSPDATPVLCYGPASIGKTFLAKHLIKPYFETAHHYYVEYLDCNALSA